MSASGQRSSRRVAPQSFVTYEGYRYLKATAIAVLLATALFVGDEPLGGRSGGTWAGYGLGTVATGTMLWLMWFGVRKRAYRSRGAPLRGWLSAHSYVGLSLLVIVPLHSAFQFGWNIHTLAFALMVAAILTGIVGVLVYDTVPARMTRNRPGQELSSLYEQIAELDGECRRQASALPDEFARAVRVSIEETRIGGGVWAQLLGRAPNCGTARAVGIVEQLNRDRDLGDDGRDQVRRLIEALSLKQRSLSRVRRDIQYKALIDSWLVLHVPLAFASVVAVAVHIFVVFYYR